MADILDRSNRHLFLEDSDNTGNSFIANVNEVADRKAQLDTVAADIENINAVGEHIDKVDTVANNIQDISDAVDNINTVKTFNDNVNNGTMQYLLEAFTESLDEEGNAWVVRLTRLGESIVASTSAFNYSTVVTVITPIASGGTLTLPSPMKYKVGTHMLMVSWNGTVCYAGEQYNEVGAYGVWSTTITLNHELRAGDKVQFRIVALTDASSFVDITETALNSAEILATGSSTGRTLPARFSDIVNVKDFGAKSDDNYDDTVAFQSAIATGKCVFVPSGTYKLTTNLIGTFCSVDDVTFVGGTVNGSSILRGQGNRNKDVINVKDFGAKGDGITDDTKAIQAALDKTGNVFLPAGTYLVSDTLKVSSDTHLYGSGQGATIIEMSEDAIADLHTITNKQALTSNRYTPNQYTVDTRTVDGVVYELHVITTPGNASESSYDKNIFINNLTLKNNGLSRTRISKGGSGISFYGVHDVVVENVTSIEGNQHCFDVNSMEETTYMLGHDYLAVGQSYNVKFINTKAITPWADDGLTTHDSHHIEIIGHTSINEDTERASFTYNQNGIEVDDGSSFVTVKDCYCEGFCNGILVTAHKFSPATHDVIVENCNVVKCNVAYQALSYYDDVSDEDKRSGTKSRNVVFNNNRASSFELYFTNRYLRPYAMLISGYVSCIVDGLFLDGGKTALPVVTLMHGCSDSRVSNVYLQNAKTSLESNDNIGFVYVYDNAGANLSIQNIFIDNAQIDIVRVNSCPGPIAIDRVSCVSAKSGIRGVYLYSGVAGKRIEVDNISVPSGAIPLAVGSTNYGDVKTFYSKKIGIVELNATDQSGPLITLTPKNSSSVCIGATGSNFITLGNDSGDIYYYVGSNAFSPGGTSGVRNLGTPSLLFGIVYAATGTIQTSDARMKNVVGDVQEAALRAWGKVRFKVFQFADAVEKKGDNARLHIGVLAQDVENAFKSEGIDANRFGLFCYDEWDDQYEENEVVDTQATYDENGNEITPTITHIERRLIQQAGNAYGIRYEEALALECAYQRDRATKAESRISTLESTVSTLQEHIAILEARLASLEANR